MTRDEALEALQVIRFGEYDKVQAEYDALGDYILNSIPTPKVEDASELATLRAEVERLRYENEQRMANENEAYALYHKWSRGEGETDTAMHGIGKILCRPIMSHETARTSLQGGRDA